MWISRKKYEELYHLAYSQEVKSEGGFSGDGLFITPPEQYTYKELYEGQEKELFKIKAENLALEHERDKYKKLAYSDKYTFSAGAVSYKELYKEQQNLNNSLSKELSQEAQRLQSEIDDIKGLKTYVLESGEEVKAEKIRTNDKWLEFIKDGEVFKTVELQEWEIK